MRYYETSKTALLALCAVMAFAGNSLLSRAALVDGGIDWASFTAVRLISGAVMLALLLGMRHGNAIWPKRASLGGIASLFAYGALFTLAYVNLTTATGALILFSTVQITMQAIALLRGDRPGMLQWCGMVLALAGLVWLLLPGLAAPPLIPSTIMAAAGISWGIYSWVGRSAGDAALSTARNFIGAAALALLLLFWVPAWPNGQGIALALVSGMVTSALGYIVWYALLPRIGVVTAGAVQLSVPAIAAMGGVLFLSEVISARLVSATILIFAGIALTLKAKVK